MCARKLTRVISICFCSLYGCVLPQSEDAPRLPIAEESLSQAPAAIGAEKTSNKAKPSRTVAQKRADEANHNAKSNTGKNDPENDNLTRLYGELEAVREVDAELYQQLRQDLKQIDPAIRPYIVKNIRAALAIREKQNTADAESQIDRKQHELKQSQKPRKNERTARVKTHKKNSLREKADSTPKSRRGLRDRPTDSKRLSNRANEHGKASRTATVDTEQPVAAADDVQLVVHVADVAEAREYNGNTGIWREQLRRAIRTLEQDLQVESDESPTVSAAYESKQAALRILYLAAGRPDDVATVQTTVDNDRKEFWEAVLKALNTYMDTNAIPIADRRAQRTLAELRQAISSLSNMSQLHVDNLVFCSKVESYGRYTDMTPYEFTADQEVLLYVEIDNFAAMELNDGQFKTEMEGSYQIIDVAGRRVTDHTFPTEEENCRNRRRDYFIPYRMWLPKQIQPGQYTLQLTLEDKIGEKFGQASIDFFIKR